ncbi:MAG: peptidoglycan D,D-transpeptidase FtsI family protein, partial [Elusimicrobiota bacterium]
DDNQGLSGIEYSFDSYLRSEAQKKTMIKDARGRVVYLDADNSAPVTDGTRLFLSIDSGLQYIAERELKRGFYTFKPRRAMAIIQDPHTGKILAMATYPNYDNNSKRTPSSNLLKIKPVSNIIEPGSTFKIFTAAAALNEGTVETDELFDCEGGTYTVGGFPIRDFEPHDMLTFGEVIMHSSNIGMAKTAERLGRNLLYKYARDFGFGNFTGIRLPGEARGILRKPDRWSGTSLSRISFGQEVGVTGLQLVSAISAVANGGVLYEPQIIEKMKVSGDIEQFNPMPIRRVIKKETASKLNSILIDAVKKGSGEKASVRGYPVAGKTGTAQKLDFQTLTYSRDKYNAIFGGYIPADDPRLSILVIFEEPEGPFHWGGYVSAPVFSEIARASVSYLNIPPSESLMELAER